MPQLSYEDVLSQTTELIIRHLPAPVPVTPASEFKADLQFDSMGIMDLVADIEDHFDITIPLNELPRMQTVAQTAERLVALTAAR
jgi:acyl carrier protein